MKNSVSLFRFLILCYVSVISLTEFPFLFVSQSPREFHVSHFLEQILVCAYTHSSAELNFNLLHHSNKYCLLHYSQSARILRIVWKNWGDLLQLSLQGKPSVTTGVKIHKIISSFFLLINTRSGLLPRIWWSFYTSKPQRILCI